MGGALVLQAWLFCTRPLLQNIVFPGDLRNPRRGAGNLCHESLLILWDGLVSFLLFFVHFFFHRKFQVQFISSFPPFFFFELNFVLVAITR